MDLPNAMANDLDFAIPRSLYYYVASHKLDDIRTYNHEDMLIYSKIITLMIIILAIKMTLTVLHQDHHCI